MHIVPYVLEIVAFGLVLSTLPVIAELAILTLASIFPGRTSHNREAADSVRLAVIIPAHNEELLIRTTVQSLRASAGESATRVIVVAHNCSDRTALRAEQAGAEVLVCNDPLAKGKGAALAAGFAYTTTQNMDATLVVDADSTVSANLITEVRHAMASGVEAVQCRYEMECSPKRPATRLTALAFRGFNVVRATGRARLRLSAGIVGNGFAVRQAILQQNLYNSHSVVEDLEFHIRLVLAGKRVQFLEHARVQSALPVSKQGESSQRSRWEGGRANAARAWSLTLVKQLALGRFRMLEPLLDLLSLPIGYAVFLLSVSLCFPLLWLRGYALVALAVIGCHVLAAARYGPDFAGDLKTLARVPGYILWKLLMLPALIRSSDPGAKWVRTDREAA
jgi:cellulose synthase/poly-beta-1,6-N-acetylglucosamine synthase-like glycosyltransferase